MKNGIGFYTSVALLVISILANAWLLSERTQIQEIKFDMKRLTERLERLTATVGVLTVILGEHSGVEIPWPFDSGR